jgi:PEP-CTERM motif
MLKSFMHRLVAFSFPVLLIVGFTQKRADAVSLVGISESNTSFKAQFSLDGLESGNDQVIKQNLQWWHIVVATGRSYGLDGVLVSQFGNNSGIESLFFVGKTNPENASVTFGCGNQPRVLLSPYCTDTLAYSLRSNPDGGADTVDFTGERAFNIYKGEDVPEPTTALGSGLAILAGVFLRRRILATNRTSKFRSNKGVKV